MIPQQIVYPLDPTGTNVNNLVLGEPHTLVNRTVRAIAPHFGPFFTESLVVRDTATGQILTPLQYKTGEMDVAPTGFYGKEICSIILITDTNVSSQIEIDYQVLGGHYSMSVDAIVSMLNSAEMDNRPVAWGDIINKPPVFEAASHYHDIGDIYGFEYVVTAIERLRSAILVGDSASHDEIYRYIDSTFTQLDQRVTQVDQSLTSHKSDMNNPHQTTKAQIGLGSVDNFQTATQQEAEAGTATNRFMTPQRTAQTVNAMVTNPLNSHIQNQSNPHNVTKTQVGLGSVNDFGLATLQEAQAGQSNVKYMTPYLTAQAITTQAGALIQSHVDNINNPHQTTKAQVGLGSVDDFQTATQAEAEGGQATNRFMTPQRTAQAINALVSGTINAHIANQSNPHNVTKSQVGLGNVDNFATSGEMEARNGTRNDLFMTPLRTSQAIATIAGTLVAQHTSRFDNPHNVTKSQIGLGNVDNFATASAGDATGGTRNDVFMTALRVREAITAFGAPAWYQGWVPNPGLNADDLPGSRSGFTYAYNAPYIGSLVHFDAGGYGLELNSSYQGQNIAYRNRNGDASTWQGWKVLGHADGSNASGVWNISITGSATNAVNATNATNATSSGRLQYLGDIAPFTGPVSQGGTLHGVYNNGYPTTYGNVLTLQGAGAGQLLLGWSSTTGGHAENYIRSLRDAGNTWSPWARIITDINGSSLFLSLANGGTVSGGTTFNAGVTCNSDLTVNGNARTGNWWRSTGQTGWYNESYNVGIYAVQAGWVDTYNGASIRATDLYTTSDARIKTDIEQVKNARDRLYKTVKGCSYLKNGIPGLGVIAQDVQIEFPQAVVESADQLPNGDKILTVNYNALLAPMIEAGRETDEQLQALSIEHEDLKRDHALLRTQFNELLELVNKLVNK